LPSYVASLVGLCGPEGDSDRILVLCRSFRNVDDHRHWTRELFRRIDQKSRLRSKPLDERLWGGFV